MVYTRTYMKLAHFHDFYYLQALDYGIKNEIQQNPERGFLRSVEKLQEDVNELQNIIYPKLALRTFVYLYVTCLGEARHANDPTAWEWFIPETCKLDRETIYNVATDYRPTPQNIEALVKVFDQKWGSGFGGKAWKSIAEALFMYYNNPPSAFLDHVVDLEHNNGTAFSKTDARKTIKFDVHYEGRFSTFLDYKFKHNILKYRFNYFDLYVTPEVYKLIQRYTIIFNEKEVDWVKPRLSTLDEYYVYWNDKQLHVEKKWKERADVQNGNKAQVSDIVQVAKLDEVNPKYLFVNEYKKAINKLTKEHLGIYDKKEHKQVKEYAKAYYENRISLCKKTHHFSALPCSVKQIKENHYGVTIKLDIKGFGKRVEGGRYFEMENYHSNLECDDAMITMGEYGHAVLHTPQKTVLVTGEVVTILE